MRERKGDNSNKNMEGSKWRKVAMGKTKSQPQLHYRIPQKIWELVILGTSESGGEVGD